MTLQIKIILAAAAVLLIGIGIASVISNARARSLEQSVDAANAQAKANEEAAVTAEIQAAEYEQKIAYLETQIAEIGSIARKQDEELKKLGGDVVGARRDVERTRRLRAIDTTNAELCGKLAELGYPC